MSYSIFGDTASHASKLSYTYIFFEELTGYHNMTALPLSAQKYGKSCSE
jgi:hypothetical protein